MKKPFYKYSPGFLFLLFGLLVAGLLIWAEIDYGFLNILWGNITG